MLNSIKSFFKIVGLEITKVFRNKVVLFSLVLFTFFLLILMSLVSSDINAGSAKINIGINKNGIDIKGTAIERVLEIGDKQGFEDVLSLESGIKKVSSCELDLFININENTNPLTISVYYDKSNYIARTIVNELNAKTSKLIQETTNDYLNIIGITLDDKYFDIVDYEAINKQNVDFKSSMFVSLTLLCLGVVIIYGLAYSMARDNETQTIKNVCYMPMGTSRYLFSKMVPYLFLGIIEFIGALIIGALLYNISYQINIIALILFSLFFIIALICLGLLLSMFKSQTAAIIIGSLLIIFPLLSAFSTVIRDMPAFLQIIFRLIPGLPFYNTMSCLVFNGVVLWKELAVLLLQIFLFYTSAYLLLKRKVEK